MKIAFLGKGGSGKTSLSWAMANRRAELGDRTVAIDADHNQDLIALFGVEPGPDTATFHRRHDEFRVLVGLQEDRAWHRIVLEPGRTLPSFSLTPPDPYTKGLLIPVSERLDVMLVGIGSEDTLHDSRCAHGHSAPLKFYLPLLAEGDSAVIIDSVAGTDMLTFGLYAGVDAIVASVEPHRNSMKVFDQILRFAAESGIPCYGVLNKPADDATTAALRAKHGDRIIGELPLDPGIAAYDYSRVAPETKHALDRIWETLRARTAQKADSLGRLRAVERMRAAASA